MAKGRLIKPAGPESQHHKRTWPVKGADQDYLQEEILHYPNIYWTGGFFPK